MKKEFVRNPYNYDSDQESLDTALKCEDKSLAQQQFKEESDINFIANKFALTGEAPQLPDGFQWGARFDQVFDYQTAMNAVVAGERAFMTLPAKVRKEFDNDPQKLLEFLEEPKNKDEAIRLGLIPRAVPESPVGAPAGDAKGVTPTPAAKPAGEAPSKPQKDT